MTFYGQPPSATHHVRFVLLVCLFLAFTFFFSAETLFFAYFILVLLPYVTTDFFATRHSNKNSRASIWRFASVNHALLIWCYRNAALIFKKYGGHCVACPVDMVASYSSSLPLRVVYLLVQGLSFD